MHKVHVIAGDSMVELVVVVPASSSTSFSTETLSPRAFVDLLSPPYIPRTSFAFLQAQGSVYHLLLERQVFAAQLPSSFVQFCPHDPFFPPVL